MSQYVYFSGSYSYNSFRANELGKNHAEFWQSTDEAYFIVGIKTINRQEVLPCLIESKIILKQIVKEKKVMLIREVQILSVTPLTDISGVTWA